MTRPPRPKYPSDAKDYHEIRRPGCAHTIRLPEDLLPTYVNLKRCLRPRTSHTDVIRFLFEASEAAIQGGETHKAVKDFMKKYVTESKMKFYLRARENYISETFHSVINKFATKRIHFDASHNARLACAALDRNENIRREVRCIYNRSSNDTAVRRRARTNRVLVDRTSQWKMQLAAQVFT
ncbi:hypothetical protein R1sor_000682 [Riccia sorocarpa]|uniref:Uncharacterized protein n=1 Tax=Riccia sorocarpa TaxID=122646 RepID=A0ABD3GX11_9MARC